MESTPISSPEKRRLNRIYILQRISLFAAIVLLGDTLSYLPVYLRHPEWWQVLVDIITTAISAGSSFLAYRAFQNGKMRTGYLSAWMVLLLLPLAASLVNTGPLPLVAIALVAFLLFLVTWPDRWERWLSATAGYIIFILVLTFLLPIPALTPAQATSLTFSDTLSAILVAFLILYELIRWLPNLSIRSRLLVTSLGAVFVPLVIVTGLSVYFALSGGRQQLLNHLTSVAQLKKNQIALWEENIKSLVETLVNDPQASTRYQYLLQSGNQAQQATAFLQVDQQFRQYIATTPYFEELFILSPDGKVVYSTDPRRQGQILSSATFFQLGLLESTIQPPVYDTLARQNAIIASSPIRDPNGKTIGVVAGRASLKVLDDIMQEREGLSETGETYLVGLNHALLTSAREADTVFGGAYVNTEGVRLGMQTKGLGSAQYTNYAGEEVLGVYAWVPELQAVLLAEQETSDAFGEVYISLLILGGLALAGSAFAALMSLYITRGISEPLNELAQIAGRIASGDIEAQAPVRSNDEIAALAAAFNAMTARLRSLISTLEKRVAQRTEEVEIRSWRVETVAQIGSAIASIRDMDVLLTRITHLISDRLGYYHVGIFLLDERGEYAILRAANSEGGQRMLARQHRLRVGETGLVGYVTAHRQPRIALDVGEDAVYFDNPDLPGTHSEAALPLISGPALLGALDVQSTEPNAFAEEDIHILQLLADQLAIAIENAHLFAQAQQALEEAQRAYGELSQQAWLRLLEEGVLSGGYHSGSQGEEPLKSAEPLPPLARQAIQEKTFIQQTDGDVQRVAIPLQIRGATIGVVETYKPRQAGRWSPEELETLQNIVAELGDALESARLYTETSLRAESERRLAEIAAQVRSSLDTEDILQAAVRHIQQAFALAEVEIRMEHPAEE